MQYIVRTRQLEEARSVGADEVLALDDDSAMAAFGQADIVANPLRGPAADRLLSLVKRGGTFASVTGAPSRAGQRTDVKVVDFVSKNSIATLIYTAEAARSGKLVIPVSQRLSLADAHRAHELLANGAGGKILLLA